MVLILPGARLKAEPSAGDLRYRVGFYSRLDATTGSPPPPDYGNPIDGWPNTANFILWADINPRLGGETVMAARLSGKNYVNITVRQSTQAAQITTDWKCKNEVTGEEYNIRSIIDPFKGTVKHAFFFEMLCESGVAI